MCLCLAYTVLGKRTASLLSRFLGRWSQLNVILFFLETQSIYWNNNHCSLFWTLEVRFANIAGRWPPMLTMPTMLTIEKYRRTVRLTKKKAENYSDNSNNCWSIQWTRFTMWNSHAPWIMTLFYRIAQTVRGSAIFWCGRLVMNAVLLFWEIRTNRIHSIRLELFAKSARMMLNAWYVIRITYQNGRYLIVNLLDAKWRHQDFFCGSVRLMWLANSMGG